MPERSCHRGQPQRFLGVIAGHTCMPPQDSETSTWFAREVQPHEGMLRSYLIGLARPSDIDDLVQESYARLLRMREQQRLRSPRGLLFTMARNAAHDLFRRRGTAAIAPVTETERERVVDETPGIAEVVSRRQEIELLAGAIEALPERCRAVFILRQFENLSQREIAARLGIAEHTVESQLTKALRRCEDFFAARGALPRQEGKP
ncbi:MAG: RNA polymerase sigma factor [Verrucomicrobia bacterium]|nr:RNA polymerase sigma factor [Verrucomicrobiota bacterium]